jgi:hypothetical protein
MIKFDNIHFTDGKQLLDDLAIEGIVLDINTQAPLIDGEGYLWLDVSEEQRQQVQNILNAHVPKPAPEPTIADKLASVGLSLDELKAAILGGS